MAGSLELRAALRSLARNRGFTVIAILMLAIGVGGSTAMFSLVNQVLIRPLPYTEADRLVRIYQYDTGEPAANSYVTGAAFHAYREQLSAFRQVAALYTYRETGTDLVTAKGAERIRVLSVSADYFAALRALPVLGRTHTRAEETPDARVVVLSNHFWRSHFDASDAILGQAVNLSGVPHTVIGVARAGLEDPVAGVIDAWTPLDLRRGGGRDHPDNHYLTLIGRLKPDATLSAAQTQVATIDTRLAEQYPDAADAHGRIVGLHQDVVAGSDRMLFVLLGATLVVLLIVCVNVANLLLTRASAREREFAIRAALGSGRAPILRQLLMETMLLAGAGALLGCALTIVLVRAIVVLGASSVPRVAQTQFDLRVLAFALLAGLGSALLFGLLPALRFAQTVHNDVLRDSSRSVTAGRGRNRVRSGLVIAQVALGFVLLAGAAILLLSFQRMRNVDLGITVPGTLTFEVHLPEARYDAVQRARFHEQLTTRIKVLPGVSAAGATSRLPATGEYHIWGSRALSGPLAGDQERNFLAAQNRTISGDYFSALGMRVLAGRTFDARDAADLPMRAVLSRAAAQKLFPGTDPIGQRLRVSGTEREVIGVVNDIGVDVQGAVRPTIYHAHTQFAADRNWGLTYVVSTTRDPESLIPVIRQELRALDQELVLFRPAPLSDVLEQGIAQRRFSTWLMGSFALVALVLASLGLFGVIAYAVRQRRRELGIRLALGARPLSLSGMVVTHALALAGIGITLGLAGALAAGRVLDALAFETDPADPLILGATTLIMLIVAVFAAAIPAREATLVDPVTVLQDD